MVHVGLGRSSSQVTPRLSSDWLLVLALLPLLLLHLHRLLHMVHLVHLLVRLVPDDLPGLTGCQGLEADVGPGVLTAVQAGGHGGGGFLSSSSQPRYL